MKKLIYTAATFLMIGQAFSQQESKEPQDTTRMKFGKVELLVIDHSGEDNEVVTDTIDASPDKEEVEKFEPHWAGFDLGVNVLLNDQYGTNFSNNPYWENDPANSFNFGLNLLEHKFSIYKNYVGLTTGLGFNFTQVGFKNNYVLMSTQDSVYGVVDTVYNYTKNKLLATYVQVPLLLEFNTRNSNNHNFYLATGIIGGVRLSSKINRAGNLDGKTFSQVTKGVYALNSFKLDATVRMGYEDWGVFATYALIPLFESGKTVDVHPFTVGLTHNF